MNEQFSAFLDGEATRDEADAVLNGLLRDESLRNSWSRQHWIRTTLRAPNSEAAVGVDTAFSGRVMSAIARDEHIETVPHPARSATLEPTGMIGSRRRRRMGRGVAGMGMAAAVAGIVLLSGNPFTRGSGDSRMVTTASSASASRNARNESASSTGNTASAQREFASNGWNDRLADFSTINRSSSGTRRMMADVGAAMGMSQAQAATASALPVSASQSGEADRWSVSDPAVRSELNGYLVDHNGMARGYGMSSTTPGYVRVATYGQGTAQ